MNSGIRIGFVSTYNAESGTASIYYPDRCNQVTDELPVFTPFGLLQTLTKDDAVLVLHLSNGSEAGIVLGGYSVDGDVPEAGLSISNGNLILKDSNGSISLKTIIDKCQKED